ncbi:MAG: HAMP domain-containing histidine kinase [Anaerolineae bacterium]|nr:HAMP domain-containing histidine kinase [Anaerolineae bacterium]
MPDSDVGTNTPNTSNDSHFAPAARAAPEELQHHIELIAHHPIVDAILAVAPGLLVVLNTQRQILTLNNALQAYLGLDEPYTLLGLRPGEALKCVHASAEPGGCGTSKSCTACGAVLAMMACLESDEPVQRECVATVQRDHNTLDLFFQVRCTPIQLEGQRFLVLCLWDTTDQQKRTTLERMFFHDIGNLIGALGLGAELFDYHDDVHAMRNLAARINKVITQLKREVEIQRVLRYEDMGDYAPLLEDVPVVEVLHDVQDLLVHHPAAAHKQLDAASVLPTVMLRTDRSLLARVLINMLINAFEATSDNGTVRMWIEQTAHTLAFCVWNQTHIPPHVAPRIFQRNFSTKLGLGRGLGTYTIKLFGETYLKGRVSFTTAPSRGTTFRLSLPLFSLPNRPSPQSLNHH